MRRSGPSLAPPGLAFAWNSLFAAQIMRSLRPGSVKGSNCALCALDGSTEARRSSRSATRCVKLRVLSTSTST
eukprot:scaffold27339_cov28-Tisochrysis_lutea.AAC.1